MQVRAPGKLILSGEHAVVHGSPVLAMAVDCYTIFSLRADGPAFTLKLADLSFEQTYPLHIFPIIRARLRENYQAFLDNQRSIREVLTHPAELVLFTLSLLIEKSSLQWTNGLTITLQSTIPMGCGMGSSAAFILSVLFAMSKFFALDAPLDQLVQLGLEAENMQHGRSSGIDLRVSALGGCVYLANKQAVPEKRNAVTFPLFRVDTGTPVSTTGECVQAASVHFKNSNIIEDFTTVTKAMDQSLAKNFNSFKDSLKENHRLLTHIGVVPEKVQSFIQKIEEQGGAAKICGAGSVVGDFGGVVLVTGEDQAALQSICSQFDYPIQPLTCALRGVHDF